MLQHDGRTAFVQSRPMKKQTGRPYDGEDLRDPAGMGEPWKLRNFTDGEIKRWTKYICWYLNEPPTALARRMGLAGTTFTRWLNKDVSYKISASTLEKLENEARNALPIEYFYDAPGLSSQERRLINFYRTARRKSPETASIALEALEDILRRLADIAAA